MFSDTPQITLRKYQDGRLLNSVLYGVLTELEHVLSTYQRRIENNNDRAAVHAWLDADRVSASFTGTSACPSAFLFQTIGLSCALKRPLTFPQIYCFETRTVDRSDTVNQSLAYVSCLRTHWVLSRSLFTNWCTIDLFKRILKFTLKRLLHVSV
jgi:hypothetical protein